jgi:hypothetical protein
VSYKNSTIQVLDIKENKDGTASVSIAYDSNFPKMVRNYYKKKRCTQKMMQKFVIESLEKYIKEKKNEKN